MWYVELTKYPTQNDFRAGYFPRALRYKKDAEKLIKEVEGKGGKAILTKGKAKPLTQ